VKRTFFITGTDTGVGKTVLTALLTRFLRKKNVAALKPVCSGGRDDARVLFVALEGNLSLDEINPWHFRAPIAPTLAARRESKTVKLAQALKSIRAVQSQFEITLVEGAGGLLSPLGEDFDSRNLLQALDAVPVIVCPNRLGAVNQVRLVMAALPEKFQKKARIVLMSPQKSDTATKTNPLLLAEFFPAKPIFLLPWLEKDFSARRALKNVRVRKVLAALADFKV